MAAVSNIEVLLELVTVPVIIVLLSWVGCKLQDYHILARRLLGKMYRKAKYGVELLQYI